MYVGQDGRTRITEIHRIKFFPDGFKNTDARDEMVTETTGSVIVVHTIRPKAASKRIILEIGEGFNIEQAQYEILKNGYLDLSACRVVRENLY
jgi:hypothetical protein